jgi:Ca2+/H+ antiporter
MLENPKVNIKIKLSVLWASVLFCYLYGDYFELYVPDKVDSLLSGANILDSPTKLLIASLVLAIPSLMVALSILLNPKINRILNIFFGILFTVMMLFIGINSLTPWYSFYVFLAFLESLITILIVWFAWKWPKKTPALNGNS